MKSKIIYSAFFLLLSAQIVNGQTSDRDYIISKMRVFYVANPNAATPSLAQISPNTIISSQNIFGTTGNSNMDRCVEFLKQLFSPVAQGGMPQLQRYTANIIRLNGKIINMYLFNDYSTNITPAAETALNLCVSASRSVWPCAYHIRGNRMADTVSGWIKMGEQYFRDNGITVGRRTFLHELMHTQDPSDRREHIWYSSAAAQSFSYGSDNVHYFVELTPNITATYQEGIANTFTYLYSNIEKRETLNWFAENGEAIVEVSRPAHIAASNWLYSQISSVNPPGAGRTPTSPRYNASIVSNYKIYRLAELPSRIILHNEKIMGIIAAEFSEKVGFSKFITALRHTNRDVTNVSTSPLARLIENFCTEALPAGLTVQDVTAVSRAEMPYLYPLALVDYFTYYRTQTKAEYRALFENLLPEVWVDLYWTAGKDIVRNAARFNMRNGQPAGVQPVTNHITAIANSLQVRNSN
jgi:hypothetical protein